MEQLINSRLNQKEPSQPLQNLSPEKFGKGAYANLTYTPSKLANNVLYKEVTSMKKIEEGTSKVRELEAMVSLLKEKLKHSISERGGIEKALSLQISMYKDIISEM